MKIKELLEGRHGYDDSGMSLSPGHDEGPDSWDYSAAHDKIGAGDPRRPRQYSQQADVPHDVHIDGRKWKTFGSHSHASNVARKLQSNGKKATVVKSLKEFASAPGNMTTAANVGVGAVYKNKPVKQPKNKDGTAKNALDMKGANLLGGGSVKR